MDLQQQLLQASPNLFFGFFIITIGVAYYHSNSKEKVGIYSVVFSSIGLLSLLAHILQHYFFGVVGEKAMINVREALYTGKFSVFPLLPLDEW